MKKVSIITAVYNREETISRAMKSVFQQSYSNIEYILIDGKSSDGTTEIIGCYLDRIAVFVSEKDAGIYDALNKGLGFATGDIIGFLHSDDYLANDFVIEHIVKSMSDCDAVYGDLAFFKMDRIQKVTRFYSSSFFRSWMLRFALQPAHTTFYAKKEVYKTLGNFNLQYQISADFDWFVRFFSDSTFKVKYLPRIIIRSRNGGISTESIRTIIHHNAEDLVILKRKNIHSNWGFVLMKFAFKLTQLRF